MKLTDKFVAALVRADVPAYVHAQAVNLPPWRLSRLVHAKVPITPDDQGALVKIGKRLGLDPADCFGGEP